MNLYNIFVPWVSHDGERKVNAFKFFTPTEELDVRVATRLIRKWYASFIQRSVDKRFIRSLYKTRLLINRDATPRDVSKLTEVTNDIITELTAQDKTQRLTTDTPETASTTG